MARLCLINKNNKRKEIIDRSFLKRKELKEQIKNKDIDSNARMELVFKLAEMKRDSSPTRHRNRCELSGRPRGYYRKFKLSRNQIRELAGFGLLPGVIKSSW